MDFGQLLVFIMELIGTVAFSASGAMVAIEKSMDIFGVCVLGVCTAVGGGMVRDIILGNVPDALTEPVYVAVAAATALMVFLVLYMRKEHLHGRSRAFYDSLMLIMDAVGLGIFTGVGVLTGIRAGYPNNEFLLVFLGTITGVGGGLLRDMMAGVPPYIFVKHIYALASIAGACIFVLLYKFFGEVPALVVSSILIIAIRLLAAHYHWNLPRLKIIR
jgi:uncharacterized membrane protein YeiH